MDQIRYSSSAALGCPYHGYSEESDKCLTGAQPTKLSHVLDELLSLWEKERVAKSKWFNRELVKQENPLFVGVARIFKDYAQALARFPYPVKRAQFFDAISAKEKFFVSTAFNKIDFSGGGAFNTQGNLIGINVMKPPVPSFGSTSPSPFTSAISIEYIKKRIGQKFDNHVVNQVFHCTNR